MSGPPQQWQPAPAWNPPPRRRRSRWLTIGLPVALVVVVLGVLGFVVVRGFVQGIGPAQDATTAYARALVEQRWEDAHAMLCEASADEFGPEDLAASFAEPPLTAFSIEAANVRWSNGRTSGEATVLFEAERGVRERTLLPLVEEDGEWRPCP